MNWFHHIVVAAVLLTALTGTAVGADGSTLTGLDVAVRDDHAVLEISVGWLDRPEPAYELYFEYREAQWDVWKTTDRITPNENTVNEIIAQRLTPGTTYEFRAVLEDEDGRIVDATDSGSFTTDGQAPSGEGGDGFLGSILVTLKDLPGNIVGSFFGVFDAVAQTIVDILTYVIVAHPTVHPNEDVSEIHQKTLLASLLLSGAAVVLLGILLILGFDGVSQHHPAHYIGKIVLAMVLGAVAPVLIQYAVDFSYALTVAFKPADAGLLSASLLTVELVVIGFLNAFILLAIAVTFVIRDLYFLFFAAAAPFIFLLWATPYFRRFGQVLIGTFWGFILIGPLEMIAFSLTLSLLEMNGMEIPHWLLGFGGLVFMFVLPLMVVPAAWIMVGSAAGLLSSASGKSAALWKDYRNSENQETPKFGRGYQSDSESKFREPGFYLDHKQEDQ